MPRNTSQFEDFQLAMVHRKINQKIKLLLMNDDFLELIKETKKKWESLAINYEKLLEQQIALMNTAMKKYGRDSVASLYAMTDNEMKELGTILSAINDLPTPEFLNDLQDLAKKFKLYPLREWSNSLAFIVLGDFVIPPTMLHPVLDKKGTPRFNLNFLIDFGVEKATNEPQLKIQLFEDTTIDDIKNGWNIINQHQQELRKIKDIDKKRYYPLKNMDKAKKLLNLDTVKYHYGSFFKGRDDKEKRELLPYGELDKAEEIYGEVELSGKAEKKAKNKLKQLRHQYRKRLTR
jgi:hypothetical protein